jgi:hypothetical protein
MREAKLTSPIPVSDPQNPLCSGTAQYKNPNPASFSELGGKTLGVAGLSLQTPGTLLNSMISWDESGLLDVSGESLLILNDPHPGELALGLDYGFRVVQPKDIPNAKINPKYDNVVTIGAAFYYAMEMMSTDYVIFLEKDFMADVTVSREKFMSEILAGMELLEEGAWIIRMRSRKQQGCDSFKDCGRTQNWSSNDSKDRIKNHWNFYCDNYASLPGGKNMVSQCVKDPEYRCHTSFDSNWSLNAVMVKRETMLEAKPKGGHMVFGKGTEPMSLAEFGLSTYDNQAGFEGRMISEDWGQYKLPVCISVDGIFLHVELDG